MDPKAKQLLDELNLDQTTGPVKKPAVKKPGTGEQKAGVVNASADELLGELGIDKKKSLSPGQSDGSNAGASDTQQQQQQPNYQEILKAAQDFLTADYNTNRQRIDPALASSGWGKSVPISMDPGKDAATPKNPSPLEIAGEKVKDIFRGEDLKKNPLPPMDMRFFNAVNDPSNASVLKDYYKSRVSNIDEDYEAKVKAIEERYPMKTQVVSAGADQVRLYRPDQAAYDAEMSAVKAERDKIKADLTKNIDILADKRIFNEAKRQATTQQKRDNSFIDIEKIGKRKLEILNDPNIEKIKRWQAKGIPIDDGQMFNIDRVGLSSVQSALMQEINERGTRDKDGKIVAIPDDLRQSIIQADKLGRGLWEKHATFRKQQVVRALSDKIYKNKSSFKTTTGLYTISMDDVKQAAKELGFDDKLIADVKPGDIKSANIFGTFVNELAMRPSAGVGSFLGRNFRKHILGQDEDWIDYHYQELKKDFTSFLADPVDVQSQFGMDYIVDTDKNSASFLENIPNPKKGKFNWSIDAIANTVTGGMGQLMSYAYGGGATGNLLKAAGAVRSTDMARKAGLITYAFVTQYDDNYVQAKEMGLNEGAANGFSFIRSLASGFTEMIFPDYKVTDALFGPNSPATKMLFKQIEKKGLNGLSEQSMKAIFKRALLDGGINTGKETLEEFADQGADILTTIMFKPDALKERDIPREFLEVGVQTAIGTILPITAGAYRQNRYQSKYIKNSIYQVGLDPAKYIQAIQEQVDAGIMQTEVADKKIAVINELTKIVNKTPDISPVNNKPLTDQNKVDYANNLLQDKLLQQQLADVKDDIPQEKAVKAKIAALEKEREEILKSANGVEVNIEGKPIMEGDNRPTIDPEKLQEQTKTGSSELDWLIEHYTEKLESPYRWQQLQAEQNLERIQKDPAGFLEEWMNMKDSDSTFQYTPERRAEVEQELAQLKAAQYGKSESPKDQQQPGKQGKEDASAKTPSTNEGREKVLTPEDEEGEENAPSSSADLLPPKQREKLKAQQQDKSKLPVEEFVADQIKDNKVRPGYLQMAKDNPKEFLKFVAQQANNINDAGEFDTTTDGRDRARDSFGQELIDRANKEFPEYQKQASKEDAKSLPKSIRELDPDQQGGLVVSSLKKGETINVDGKDYVITQKNDKETRIKEVKTGKTGTIIHAGGQNIAWKKTRKDGVATGFFRGIESDITRSLLDENNPLGANKTASYSRAIKELQRLRNLYALKSEQAGSVKDLGKTDNKTLLNILPDKRSSENTGKVMITTDQHGNFKTRYIPFSIIEAANKNDNLTGQTAKQINDRGGYGDNELDRLLPGWRDMLPAVNPNTGEAQPQEAPTPTDKVVEQPTQTGKKNEFADVSYVPINQINTDTDRFQPRGTDFSQETVNKLVNNFDDNKLDPIVLYNDRNGRDFVLSGHSRLAAHEMLSNLPDSDPRKQAAIEKGFKPGNIKARYFKGTEKEAIEFADRSNDLATKNKDYESAASLRKAREKGDTKTSIIERAKEDFGKNWRYIYNLSHLNPNGKAITTLKQFESNPDKDVQNKVEKAAQWIGAVRERAQMITDQHENEMFDFLMDKTRSTKLERENDFIMLVQNIIGRFDWNPNEPLNLARLKTKSVQEVSYDQEEAELKNSIKEKQDELDALNDRLNNPKNPAYVNPNSSDYSMVLQNADKKKVGINAELTQLRKDLLAHQQNKGKILSAGINQGGLFDMNNLTPTEKTELDAELKPDGINTDQIESYEQSISNSAAVPKQGANNQQETGAIPENIQQSRNDQGGGQGQDQGSTGNVPTEGKNIVEAAKYIFTTRGTNISVYSKDGKYYASDNNNIRKPAYEITEEQAVKMAWEHQMVKSGMVPQITPEGREEMLEFLQGSSELNNLNSSIAKYGWTATGSDGRYTLTNRKGVSPATAIKVKGRWEFRDNNNELLLTSPSLYTGSDKLLKEYFYAKETEPLKPAEAAKEGLDKKVEDATAKKNAALEKFKKKLNDSRGTLNVGLNPEVIAAGVELMAAYAELGVFKFAQIVRDVAENIGKDFLREKENVDALKGVYSYYRSNLDKEGRKKFDNEDQVDEFLENEMPNIIGEQEQEIENVDTFSDPKRYNASISVDDRYFDKRYSDEYVVRSIKPIPGTNDADVELQYRRRGTDQEKASFILYHIDQKQHTKIQPVSQTNIEQPEKTEPQEITFESAKDGRLTGQKIVLPGYENMDVISVQAGFERKLYELTTGMQIGDAPAFSDTEAIASIVDHLNARNFNVDKLYKRIYESERNKIGGAKQILNVNNGPAYQQFKANKEAEEASKPDRYSPDEKAAIDELIEIGKQEGVDVSNFKSMRDAKENGFPKVPISEFYRMYAEKKQNTEDAENIKADRPLAAGRGRKLDTSGEGLKRAMTSGHKNADKLWSNTFEQLPDDFQERAIEAWRKYAEIFNKYGYNTSKMKQANAPGELLRLIGTLNAKSEARKGQVQEDIDRVERAMEALNELYQEEIGSTEAENIEPGIPELTTQQADRLTDLLRGQFIRDDYDTTSDEPAEGDIERISYIQGGRVFHIHLDNGASFPATPEQLTQLISKYNDAPYDYESIYIPDTGEVVDYDENFNNAIQDVLNTEPGTEMEDNAAKVAMKHLLRLKQANGETNQIRRQAEENILHFIVARKFGFETYQENSAGWYNEPEWPVEEDLQSKTTKKGFVTNFAEVRLAQGPNGKWTNGSSVTASNSGYGNGTSAFGEVYNTRQEAIDAAVAKIDAYLARAKSEFNNQDKADFKKWEQFKATISSANTQSLTPEQKWIDTVMKGAAKLPQDEQEGYVTDQAYHLAGDRNKKLRQSIYSLLTNKKQTIAASGIHNIIAELKKQLPNATDTASNLESDSTRTDIANAISKGTVPDDGSRDTVETTDDGAEVIAQGDQPKNSPGLLPFDASTGGKRSDTEIPEPIGATGTAVNPSGSANAGGGSASDADGVQLESEPGYDTEGTFADFSGGTFEEKLAAQRAAEDIPVVIGDIQNIRASLPILMKEQQEDVLAAEKRFYGDDATNEAKNYGKAILFTNGTGTGKTLTGLGIAKRFIKRGLNNGLIVVPSDAKAFDWIQEAKDFLDINVYQLKDTQDKGEGPVVTTYANFRENSPLQSRVFDWVIYDEAHKINSNASGSQTSAEDTHKQVTLSPSRARGLAKKNINYDARLKGNNNQGISHDQRKLLDEELKQETIKLFKKTKVIFLSATPFAYHKSLTYADGYLFNINEEFDPTYSSYGYNTPNQYNSFFVSNFGYRMRYNKLTEPEAGVDVDLLERQFTERLKKEGVVVSRKLKLDQDYSRQFVVIEDGIGNVIDEGLNVVRDHKLFPNLSDFVNKLWNYLYTARLMEAIKARASVDRIKKHLALGRKVVVFHSYNEGMPQHPFNFNSFEFLAAVPDERKIGVKNDIEKFEAEYPQYANLDLRGLINPIQTLTKAFGDRLLQFNGTISKKDRKEAKRLFNDDNSGKDIIIVQMDAGKEGLSLHDKTGKHQRALISLGLPIKPTDAIQSEGRIYRTGNKTNAVIEYPILNLNFERFMYASKIKDRVRTAENLALGEESRNLEIAFKEGYINAIYQEPGPDQGTGGKTDDARMDKSSEFDKAKTYYYKKQKRTAQQKKYVSGDYYSTPEPLGFKMVEWGDVAANEKMLEPSAGHGAIARFFPGNTNNTFIEPNTDLRAEAALNTTGEMKGGEFEDLNIVNKYDVIVMNPPFGTAGKTAMEHLQKALGHLRENGRVVALVPKGKMDDRINDWLESEESEGFHIRARIDLPAVTFERAGTQVITQIIVIDKVTDEEKAKEVPNSVYRDLSRIDSVKELFERIEEMDIPKRMEKGTYAAPIGEKEDEIGTTESGIPIANSVTGLQAPTGISEVVKAFHAKQQKDIWVVKLLKHVGGEEFNGLRDIAKELDGYYSSYKGQGAIPGFVFPTEEKANKMQAAITGEKVPEGPKMSLADRIRTWKLANRNGSLNSFIIPIPAIWNAAVELVALSVEAGEALTDALRKGMDYIDKHYKEPWQKHKYNREMISELKAAGKLDYTLAPEQKAQADKILRKLAMGANIITELNRVREVYDKAIEKLTDPDDIQELEDSYQEIEDYLFHNMAVHMAEQAEAIDLGLEKQTWWQKQKENWRDMYERLGTVQKAITDAGLTIDEKNDMVNRADRWKSIAVAKINEALHEVGLADIDVFVWKGTKKIQDSLFERMAKEGIDYRKFNLYLYAKHAPERNAHNSKVRRQALTEYIQELEGQLASKEADLVLFPSSTLKAAVTRLKNEIALLTQYEEAYSDPNGNKDKVKVLEAKIPKRFHLMDDGGSGMTNQQAEDILAEVEREGDKDKFEEFEDEIREKILEKSLDLKREYGLIDQENYDYLSNYYKNYVPLRVEDSYFEENLTFAQQKLPGAKIYQSKGANYITFEKRINPLTQAVIDLQATIYEGENNRFKQTVAEAIRTAPDTKVWEVESARYTPVKDKTGKILNLKENKAPDNGIPYMEHGMKKYLVIHDGALFKELAGENVKSAIPVLSNINQFFRQIFTVYNPAFTVSNLFRDLQTAGAILSSNHGAEVGEHFRNNVKEIFKIIRASYKEQSDKGPGSSYWEQRAKEYTEGGGNMAWFRPEITTDIIKDVEETYEKYKKSGLWEDGKKMSLGLADFFNRANQAVESSTRLAIYDALLKSGIPQHKAIEIARNATVNFNKKGNFTSSADSLYLFFNASIQGTANLLYSLLTTKRGWKIAGGIALIGFIQSMYNNMMSDCSDPTHPEDCYDNIPDYEKERNIIIKIPGGHGFLKIPLPYGFNVFYNTGEQIAQNMHGKTTLANSTGYLMKTALNSFNPLGGSNTPLLQQLSPTATDPVVQWYTNRDGLGRPIYSDNQYDRRPDSEKGFASDSEWSRNFAQWMNRNSGGNEKIKGKIDMAPGTLDHLFETATGGTGLFLKQLLGTGQAIADPKRDINFHDVPILNRFYTQPRERSDRGMIYGRLDDSYNTIFSDKQRAAWQTELDKAVRLGEIKPDAAERYRKAFNKNQYQLSNPELFRILDESKMRPLEPEEIEAFVEQLQERVDNEELSINSLRAYKATITKNQRQFKEKGEE